MNSSTKGSCQQTNRKGLVRSSVAPDHLPFAPVRPLSCSLVHLTNSIEGLTSLSVWDFGLIALALFETTPVTILAAATGLGLAAAAAVIAGVLTAPTAFPPAPTVAQPPAAYVESPRSATLYQRRGLAVNLTAGEGLVAARSA